MYLKPYSRWVIVGATLFFLLQALIRHWQEVTTIQISSTGWRILTGALCVTFFAHIWSGWVWTWILGELNQQVNKYQFLRVYLKTNIAKYLPGNVWHYYGRITAAKKAGISTSIATLSVLLEPLLMAAAALIIVLVGIFFEVTNYRLPLIWLSVLGLATVLIAIHPRFLNIAIRFLGKLKLKKNQPNIIAPNGYMLIRYPLNPLLGELGFVLLRSIGFLLTLLALNSLQLEQLPLLLGAFSLAWLLGLIVPGAPGGLGVFEATVIALLEHSLSPGIVISAIAFYRLVSILAEAAAAGFAWLDEHRLDFN
ncbi:lysylphosphatidylglycerol synthase domain-containing protein [Gloeocapsopsis dulcis]|uniref:lysylphosphatidylglycerol synthase domain-containing protein n=1 Tax=Gloeocapsopsis dulcis TaxID=2859516 RepID=UPI001F32EFD5|nr:lysylphosphatidylglycerol synthase domain-containing protein [Gloeocapsopsis dulcis]WNN91414.1 lysylphosphatidylglycerol synthase domain-containing protein [Gloeocapsopsis dulcis]